MIKNLDNKKKKRQINTPVTINDEQKLLLANKKIDTVKNVSPLQKSIDIQKQAVEKSRLAINDFEEGTDEIKKARGEYKKSQEDLGRFQQEEKGIDSSKFLTEKDIKNKTLKNIENQVRKQSKASVDFDLINNLEENNAKLEEKKTNETLKEEEKKKIEQRQNEIKFATDRYNNNITLAEEERTNEKLKLRNDYEKHKIDQELNNYELENKTSIDINNYLIKNQEIITNGAEEVSGLRPDLGSKKITEIINNLKKNIEKNNAEYKKLNDEFENLYVDDEDLIIIKEEYGKEINDKHIELKGIQEKLDKMNLEDIELYDETLKELKSDGRSIGYINAIYNRRKKETFGERYLLELSYKRIQEDLNFYQEKLDTKKLEVRNDRQEKFNQIQTQLSNLTNQQQNNLSLQTQIGNLELGQIQNEQARIENQLQNKQARIEKQEQIDFEREKWEFESSIAIAKMPVGYSQTFNGKEYKGLAEDENYGFIQIKGDKGAALYRTNKNTGESELIEDLGNYYQTTGEKLSDELISKNKEQKNKIELELIKKGELEYYTPVSFYDPSGLKKFDLGPGGGLDGRQSGTFLNRAWGEEYFGGTFGKTLDSKLSLRNSITPGIGYGFVQDTGTEYGHCGIIEKVSEDGKSIFVKDSNYDGSGMIDERWIDTNSVSGFVAPKVLVKTKNKGVSEDVFNFTLLSAYSGEQTGTQTKDALKMAESLNRVKELTDATWLGLAKKASSLNSSEIMFYAKSKAVMSNLDSLFKLMEKEGLEPRDIYWDMLTPFKAGVGSTEVRTLVKNTIEIFGRTSSGSQINESEWDHFKSTFTDQSYFIKNDYEGWKKNIKSTYEQFNVIKKLLGRDDPEKIVRLEKEFIKKLGIYGNDVKDPYIDIDISEIDAILDGKISDE